MEPVSPAVVPPMLHPPTLEYARQEGDLLAGTYPTMLTLLLLSIFSGLCVGSCFLVLGFDGALWTSALHMGIYSVTLVLAVKGGVAQARRTGSVGSLQVTLDSIAGAGLIIIGLAPLYVPLRADELRWTALFPAIAFLCLTLTTYRHVLLYRNLSDLFSLAGRRSLAKSLVILGRFKCIYEFVWLGCCAIPLLAIGVSGVDEQLGVFPAPTPEFRIFPAIAPFFGCIGFGGIWIWMMIVHSVCLSAARRALRNNPQ